MEQVWTKLEGAELTTEKGARLTNLEISMADREESSTKMLVRGSYTPGYETEHQGATQPFQGHTWLREGRYFDGEVMLNPDKEVIEEASFVDEAEDILMAVELYLDATGNEVFEQEFVRIFGE